MDKKEEPKEEKPKGEVRLDKEGKGYWYSFEKKEELKEEPKEEQKPEESAEEKKAKRSKKK